MQPSGGRLRVRVLQYSLDRVHTPLLHVLTCGQHLARHARVGGHEPEGGGDVWRLGCLEGLGGVLFVVNEWVQLCPMPSACTPPSPTPPLWGCLHPLLTHPVEARPPPSADPPLVKRALLALSGMQRPFVLACSGLRDVLRRGEGFGGVCRRVLRGDVARPLVSARRLQRAHGLGGMWQHGGRGVGCVQGSCVPTSLCGEPANTRRGLGATQQRVHRLMHACVHACVRCPSAGGERASA